MKDNLSKIGNHDNELEKINIELRKLNLIVVGLADDVAENEQSLRTKLQSLITEKLTQSEVIIDNAYRIGKHKHGFTRPIKLQFRHKSHRDLIWNNRNNLRTMKTSIFVNEDLPPATQNKRRILRTECSKFFKLGHSTRLLGDKLFIDSVCYELDTNNELIQSRIPSYNRRFRTERGQSRSEEYMDTHGSRSPNFVNAGSSGSSGSLGSIVYGNSLPNQTWTGSSSAARPMVTIQELSQTASQTPGNENTAPTTSQTPANDDIISQLENPN